MRSSILLGALLVAAWASSAQVTTNNPPHVAIVSPTNGSVFTAPTNIFLLAQASDRDGDVVEVSFFANQRYIGGVTNPPPMLTPTIISPLPLWRIIWENVAPGLYSLQARARDASSTIAWSAAIRIEVRSNQPPTSLPIVNVVAIDPDASESTTVNFPLSGRFRFTRTGSTSNSLNVKFQIGGTAENGTDYHFISDSVTILAGREYAEVEISPLDDRMIEPTETVSVRIEPPLCAAMVPPPPGCYTVGANNTATVFIADAENTPNEPPVVRINSPAEGARFPEGADIRIHADAFDNDRYLDTVEFFANGRSLGIVTNNPYSLAPYVGYSITWSNVPAGDYRLTAVASDNFGLMSTSAPVRITVGESIEQTFVTIEAVDPVAAEQDPRLDALTDDALLVVRRHGPTNINLHVEYRVGGTASNGVDYHKLSGEVMIPAGAMSAEIVITALDDQIVEGTESVLVHLVPPVCIAIYPPPPECYEVGQPGGAAAYIRDNDFAPSNHPPIVRITSPTNGAAFPPGGDIRIEATTTDRDGYAPMIEFFANGRKIGEEMIHFIQAPPDGTPIHFSLVWSNAVGGAYTLTAKGTDDEGAMALSAPVFIRVETNRPPPPPPTNVVVSIVATDCYASEGPWWNSTTVRGTNTASFVVRRAGPTNDAVMVRYRVGGTAANGTDFVRLVGEATIPAGARSARIVVVPLEDAQIEGLETVVLELAPAASEPPAYLVGQPRRAAAIIADNDQRPHCVRLPGGLFHLCRPGTNGQSFRIDASSDLVHWIPVCSGVVTDGAIHFVDPDADALPRRFYRVVSETNVLQE